MNKIKSGTKEEEKGRKREEKTEKWGYEGRKEKEREKWKKIRRGKEGERGVGEGRRQEMIEKMQWAG